MYTLYVLQWSIIYLSFMFKKLQYYHTNEEVPPRWVKMLKWKVVGGFFNTLIWETPKWVVL